MAHVNISLRGDVATDPTSEAADAKASVSEYVLPEVPTLGQGDGWPEGYFDGACGFLTEEMASPADAPPKQADLGQLAS